MSKTRIALENLLPSDASALFRYQLLMDHLRLNEDEDTFFYHPGAVYNLLDFYE